MVHTATPTTCGQGMAHADTGQCKQEASEVCSRTVRGSEIGSRHSASDESDQVDGLALRSRFTNRSAEAGLVEFL